MKTELELWIEEDMLLNGFNPQNQEDIKEYWSERL